VRRFIATASLVFAWLCANGAMLDALQVVAWSKMFAGYTGTMSVSAALRETFDPAKPCALCKHVAKAKESAQQQMPATGDNAAPKFVLVLETPEPPVFASDPGDWIASLSMSVCQRTDPVPVPPPRV
jgi:hypothetical protein